MRGIFPRNVGLWCERWNSENCGKIFRRTKALNVPKHWVYMDYNKIDFTWDNVIIEAARYKVFLRRRKLSHNNKYILSIYSFSLSSKYESFSSYLQSMQSMKYPFTIILYAFLGWARVIVIRLSQSMCWNSTLLENSSDKPFPTNPKRWKINYQLFLEVWRVHETD